MLASHLSGPCGDPDRWWLVDGPVDARELAVLVDAGPIASSPWCWTASAAGSPSGSATGARVWSLTWSGN